MKKTSRREEVEEKDFFFFLMPDSFRRHRESFQWGQEETVLEEMMCRLWASESRDQGWPGRLGLLAMSDINRGIKYSTKQTITRRDGPKMWGAWEEGFTSS